MEFVVYLCYQCSLRTTFHHQQKLLSPPLQILSFLLKAEYSNPIKLMGAFAPSMADVTTLSSFTWNISSLRSQWLFEIDHFFFFFFYLFREVISLFHSFPFVLLISLVCQYTRLTPFNPPINEAHADSLSQPRVVMYRDRRTSFCFHKWIKDKRPLFPYTLLISCRIFQSTSCNLGCQI